MLHMQHVLVIPCAAPFFNLQPTERGNGFDFSSPKDPWDFLGVSILAVSRLPWKDSE